MKRYRMSYSHGIIEDTGQIFPVNASEPMVRYEDVAKLEAAAKAVIKANDVFPWDGFENALSELRKCLEGK